MDAVVDGKPVTPRTGLAVELNALWYNAIMFALELALKAGDKKFIKEWQPVADGLPKTFTETFWDDQKGYLADFVNDGVKNWDVRPNMIFAASLPYTMLDETIRMRLMDVVKRELLTPRGIRTLSPKNPQYKGVYEGHMKERDQAYHQGTVFPWLLGHFIEGYIRIYGKACVPEIEGWYQNFEDEMNIAGIGTVSEVYDGDPPHRPGGAISQAWSIAELLRIGSMIENLKKNKD
jgi:glycogen debranching enzyme